VGVSLRCTTSNAAYSYFVEEVQDLLLFCWVRTSHEVLEQLIVCLGGVDGCRVLTGLSFAEEDSSHVGTVLFFSCVAVSVCSSDGGCELTGGLSF
jgi:hypothetical protein